MDYVNLSKWLDRMYMEEGDRETKEKILHAKVLLKNAVDKLCEAGLPIDPVIEINQVMGQHTQIQTYQKLTYKEASRVLMLRDFIVNRGGKPNSTDIASYKSKQVSKYDAINESRIISRLVEKGLVVRTENPELSEHEERLYLTPLGEEVARDIASDDPFLRKIYKRSRNTKIREFIIGFIGRGKSDLFT